MRAIGAALVLPLFFAPIGVAQTKPALKEMPYVTVDHPQFIPAAQATFLNDVDRLIGVADGKVSKAYPAADLAQHGVVLDRLAEGPIAVTW